MSVCAVKARHNLLVNFESRSEIRVWGMPCRLTTVRWKIVARSSTVTVVRVGAKRVVFVKRSTAASKPRAVRGSPVIRSRDTLSQGWSGIGRGCSKPGVARARALLRWHEAQLRT